jgi:hypothetical protein
MKYFIFFTITCCLISCNNNSPKQLSESTPVDSTPSIISNIQRVTEMGSKRDYPAWLKNLYEKNAEKLTAKYRKQLQYYKQLSDSISFCLFWIHDGVHDDVCSFTWLATQKNQKDFRQAEIAHNCDADLSFPSYAYKLATYDSTTLTFRCTDYTETAEPEYIVRDSTGLHFKEGFSMDNTELRKDSVVHEMKVLSSGEIRIKRL